MGWGKKLCITWPRRIRERGWSRAEEQQWREVVRWWAPAGGRAEGSASVMPRGRSQEEATPASEETSCQKSGGDVGKCSVMETGVGGWGGERACPLVLEEAAVEASGAATGWEREWEAQGHLSSSS